MEYINAECIIILVVAFIFGYKAIKERMRLNDDANEFIFEHLETQLEKLEARIEEIKIEEPEDDKQKKIKEDFDKMMNYSIEDIYKNK